MEKNKKEDEQLLKKIELRSNDVQEILTRPPKWIVRWGITIIFTVILIVIAGSWVFKYPDIISSKIVLTTENPPAPIVAKISGKIQSLYVLNNDIVSKNQVVGVIENPGEYNSVKLLIDNLEKFNTNFAPGEVFDFQNKPYVLGEIQSSYGIFFKYLDEYNKILKLDYHRQKIALYQLELKKYDKYLRNLQDQNEILKEEYQLSNKQFIRDSVLFAQELLSEADFEKSKSDLLSKAYQFEQNNSSKTNTEIQIESLNQSILELELQKEKLISNQVILIEEAYKNLLFAINNWKHKYVLVAHTSGKVTFNQFWNENQTVKSGETVITIIPENEGAIIGKVQLNFQGAGKVKVGQKANIQFANYPYMEFGMVQGIVKSISLAPDNNYYTTEIELPQGLKTFYGIELEFKQEMQGTAEIITEDIRLIERIIRPLRYIINKNTKFGDLNN